MGTVAEGQLEIEPQGDDLKLDVPDDSAGDAANWSSESHSAAGVTEPPPNDTTSEKIAADAKSETRGQDTTATESGGQESASTAKETESAPPSKPAETAHETTPPAGAKASGEDKLRDRIAAQQKELNAATYQKHQAMREAQAEEARLHEIRAEIAKAQATQAPAATTPAEKTDTIPDLPPVVPNYATFDTDEDYQAATDQYQKDVAAWQGRREALLREDITKGLEKRDGDRQARDAAVRAETEYNNRLTDAIGAHEDWNDVVTEKTVDQLQSSWALENPDKFKMPDGRVVGAPFLYDLIKNSPAGPELLYWLGSHPEEGAALAELRPTLPIRDAIVHSPSSDVLMHYFATDDGQRDFNRLATMHPTLMNQEIGSLQARLTAAPSGSTVPVHHPVTQAAPPAKPPRGMLHAREDASAEPNDFDAWMASEDKREADNRLRLAGAKP